VKAAIDPQGRGRQFIAKAVEDLAGTRQSGFVLTRQKGEGRKAVATYALKETPSKDTPPGNGEGHTPHPPHTQDDEETSTKSTASDDGESGYASGMPGGRQGHAGGHTQGISLDNVLETEAVSMAWTKQGDMGGYEGDAFLDHSQGHHLCPMPQPARRPRSYCNAQDRRSTRAAARGLQAALRATDETGRRPPDPLASRHARLVRFAGRPRPLTASVRA
jgi:hypothetical protein